MQGGKEGSKKQGAGDTISCLLAVPDLTWFKLEMIYKATK
jgi:hypothetical protein